MSHRASAPFMAYFFRYSRRRRSVLFPTRTHRRRRAQRAPSRQRSVSCFVYSYPTIAASDPNLIIARVNAADIRDFDRVMIRRG